MFEGKEIDFYNSNGEYRRAVVVSCVKDVGITIVKKDNPNHYCLCVMMKLAPNFNHYKGAITQSRKDFTEIRKMIMTGTIDLLNSDIKFSIKIASQSSCPFN